MESESCKRTGFASVYWSAGWWGDAFSSLGIMCQPDHPALAAFPNDGHSDWQWYELTEGATTFLLEGAPSGFRALVQPVTDFHHNRLLGQVFETRVGPGKLLVCGYDLASDLDHRHAARQFRRSLLAYMTSDDFAPRDEIDTAVLERWLQRRSAAPVVAMDESTLRNAALHVRAASEVPQTDVNLPWSAEADELRKCAPGYGWKVEGGTWRDAKSSAWHGNPLALAIELPSGTEGTLYVHVHDWNSLGRHGTVQVEDRVHSLGAHADAGAWLAFPISARDSANGRVECLAQPAAGPNLMVTELAFIPRDV